MGLIKQKLRYRYGIRSKITCGGSESGLFSGMAWRNPFKCIKQNGQKLGEWHEDHEPSPEEAERILEEMKETGAYLNIIE